MAAGEEKVEAIRASDLMKLMKVVEHATGLYNFCERQYGAAWGCEEFRELQVALLELGLTQVQP